MALRMIGPEKTRSLFPLSWTNCQALIFLRSSTALGRRRRRAPQAFPAYFSRASISSCSRRMLAIVSAAPGIANTAARSHERVVSLSSFAAKARSRFQTTVTAESWSMITTSTTRSGGSSWTSSGCAKGPAEQGRSDGSSWGDTTRGATQKERQDSTTGRGSSGESRGLDQPVNSWSRSRLNQTVLDGTRVTR